MDREEAIRCFWYFSNVADSGNNVVVLTRRDKEAFDMAIEALSTSENPNKCEDAISRQAVIDAINQNCIWENEYNLTSSRIKKAVESLPPVTPQPKMGRWIAVEDEDMNTVGYFCSECDLPLETEERTPFCPYCGAKMAESEDTNGK